MSFWPWKMRKQDKTVGDSRLEESVRFAFQDMGVPPSTGSYEREKARIPASLPQGRRSVNQLPERSERDDFVGMGIDA